MHGTQVPLCTSEVKCIARGVWARTACQYQTPTSQGLILFMGIKVAHSHLLVSPRLRVRLAACPALLTLSPQKQQLPAQHTAGGHHRSSDTQSTHAVSGSLCLGCFNWCDIASSGHSLCHTYGDIHPSLPGLCDSQFSPSPPPFLGACRVPKNCAVPPLMSL